MFQFQSLHPIVSIIFRIFELDFLWNTRRWIAAPVTGESKHQLVRYEHIV